MRLSRLSLRAMKKSIEELLELESLPGFGERYPDQLSGKQQRTALEGGAM
jgi:ABC-type sulfate/molybdate transport systems ATPase subunit